MLINLFVTKPLRLLEMQAHDARHILAARSWCAARQALVDPIALTEPHLLSEILAIRFSLLMETVTKMWPEPFIIYRPCCGMASIDEALLAHAIRLAAAGERSAFDRLLHEMFSDDGRNLLFTCAEALYR